MKLKYLMLSFLLMGCEKPEKEDRVNHIKENLEFFEYDGCEYLIYTGFNNTTMTHKGNCKNH